MDSTVGSKKLDVKIKMNTEPPKATYKPISETDVEGEAVSRAKESDGADEKMLHKDNLDFNSSVVSEEKVGLNEKQNGDAKLDIGETKNLFGGMDKEELMKYANDPFWVRLRWFLFILFWVLWAAMLAGAVLIIYSAPKCNSTPRTWWEEGPITEIEPDTNPEDLKSLDTAVKGFIINWPNDAYIDFNESHQIVQIIKKGKELNKKVIVELDPATSSLWFENSQNKVDNFNDFYIWRPPKKFVNDEPEKPNNWLNIDNNSSWKYSTKRREFYYARLNRPHLNFRNENVTKAFSKVIIKFLEYGASGIQIRNAPLLLVDPKFEDETTIKVKDPRYGLKDYAFYSHTKTENLSELGPLLKQWRMVVKNKTVDGPFMMKEELTNPDVYKVNKTLVVDLPVKAQVFSRPIISVNELVNNLNHTFYIDNIKWPLWKVNSTLFPKDVLDIVTYLLPGVPLVKSDDIINEELLKMRNSPSVTRGICSIHSINNNTVFSYIRVTSGNPGILVAWNLQNETVTVNFPKDIPALDSVTKVTIQLHSANYHETEYMKLQAKKDATAIPISPYSVIVSSYVPKKKD